MKNFINSIRRWSHLRTGILVIFLVGFSWIIGKTFWVYVKSNESIFSYVGEKNITVGISLVEQYSSQLYVDQYQGQVSSENFQENYSLQAQYPTAQVYLDYISVPESADILDSLCLSNIRMSNVANLPIELVRTSSSPSDWSGGTFEISDQDFIYTFPAGTCLSEGKRTIFSHILLGILPVDASANLLWVYQVNGIKAFEFFPYDEQEIRIDIKVEALDSNWDGTFIPGIDATVSQRGWMGKFETDGLSHILHLERNLVHRRFLSLCSISLCVIILSLNFAVRDLSSFFEVTVGLFLGLWGLHEILVPSYIDTSLLVDVIFYSLYLLLIAVILFVIVDELRMRFIAVNVEIESIDPEREVVTIENKGSARVNMGKWSLSDSAGHTYVFPVFVLLPGKSVQVWTKAENRGDEKKDAKNLFLGKNYAIWNNEGDIAYLKDSKGQLISTYAYGNRANQPTQQ